MHKKDISGSGVHSAGNGKVHSAGNGKVHSAGNGKQQTEKWLYRFLRYRIYESKYEWLLFY